MCNASAVAILVQVLPTSPFGRLVSTLGRNTLVFAATNLHNTLEYSREFLTVHILLVGLVIFSFLTHFTMAEGAAAVFNADAAGPPAQLVGQGLLPQVGADGEVGNAREAQHGDGTATPQLQDAPPGGGVHSAGVGGVRQGAADGGGGRPAVEYNTPAYMPGDSDLGELQYNASVGAFIA
mgnify:CR=1 FL=1